MQMGGREGAFLASVPVPGVEMQPHGALLSRPGSPPAKAGVRLESTAGWQQRLG